MPTQEAVAMMSIKRSVLGLFIAVVSITTAWAAEGYLYIFKVSAGANIQAIADAYDGKVVDTLGDNTYLLKIRQLTPRTPVTGVLSAESNTVVNANRGTGGVVSVSSSTAPDWYAEQPALQLIRTDKAQRISTGKGIVVADINALVDYSHPSLRGHLTSGYDFVNGRSSDATLNQSTASFLDQSTASFLDQSTASFLDQSTASFLDQSTASFLDQSTASFLDITNPAHGHGTMVAGVIAAVAPDAMIMPLRVFDDNGVADHFTIAKAIRWATDHGAKVINMSFGTLESSRVLRSAVEYASSKGVTLVASAGNDNTASPQYPAAFDNVIAIAATDLRDVKAWFSNYGATVDATAPGVNIITPYPGGYFAVVSGTSFSSPMVAAEAAMLLAERQRRVEQAIEDGTVDIDRRNPGYDLGEGRVDLLRALQQ